MKITSDEFGETLRVNVRATLSLFKFECLEIVDGDTAVRVTNSCWVMQLVGERNVRGHTWSARGSMAESERAPVEESCLLTDEEEVEQAPLEESGVWADGADVEQAPVEESGV
jgi:hypothetical protein